MIRFLALTLLGIGFLFSCWVLWQMEVQRRLDERPTPQDEPEDEGIARARRVAEHADDLEWRKLLQMQRSAAAIRESRIMAGTHRGSTK